MRQKNLLLYLTSLQKLEKYYLTNNWFARPESKILINILKISVAVKDDVDTSLFYELAVKCLSVFNSEQKLDIEYLFSNIIFSLKFYPSEILMQNLDISQRSSNLETSLENIEEIMTVYSQVLGLRNVSTKFKPHDVKCYIAINCFALYQGLNKKIFKEIKKEG